MGPENARRILEHSRSMRAEMVGVLEELIRTESPSSEASTQGPILSRLAELLGSAGFRSRRLPGKTTGGQLFAVPAVRPRHRSIQLLLGHCDTVWPEGTLETHGMREEDGRLYGPGSYDMKAGLVQLLFALETLRELDQRPEVVPVVLVNSDEEIGSHESRRTIQRLARLADRAFVLEPSLGPAGDLKTARKGVGSFRVRVIGKAAHAGLEPERGASAILELSHVVQRLFALNDPGSGISVNVGTIDGGLRPNVVAPEGRVAVDARVPSHEVARRVEAAIRGLRPVTPGTEIRVEGGFGRPPMERENNRELWRRARQAADWLELPLGEATAGGGSDGNFTSQQIPTLDGMGAVGGGAHAVDESVVLDRLAERSALLAVLMMGPEIGRDHV